MPRLSEKLSRNKKCKEKIIPTKGPWKKFEDDILRDLVNEFGPKNWSYISAKINEHEVKRLGKQCRERWYNHLSPNVRKDPWADEEDRVIIESHQKYGSKWTTISSLLYGRTPNAIKNRWNSTLKRLTNGGSDKKRKKSDSSNTLATEQESSFEESNYKKRRLNSSEESDDCFQDSSYFMQTSPEVEVSYHNEVPYKGIPSYHQHLFPVEECFIYPQTTNITQTTNYMPTCMFCDSQYHNQIIPLIEEQNMMPNEMWNMMNFQMVEAQDELPDIINYHWDDSCLPPHSGRYQI